MIKVKVSHCGSTWAIVSERPRKLSIALFSGALWTESLPIASADLDRNDLG